MVTKGKPKNEGQEKRSYFRVDDVIPVVIKHVSTDEGQYEEVVRKFAGSKAFPLAEATDRPVTEDDDFASTPANRKLYGLLSEINAKLDYLINQKVLEREGLLAPEKKLVNISASGIRFTVENPVKQNDVMEIKLLLPTYPPVAILAHGEVKRVKPLDDGKFEIALEYLNMGNSVRNEIIQYTLSHQRETIRKLKESEGNE